MKKTLSINIGSKVFNIDNDAYELLKKYLDSIKSYFEKIETEEDILLDGFIQVAQLNKIVTSRMHLNILLKILIGLSI